MKKTSKRLAAAEFEAACSMLTREMSPLNLAAVRRVLVDGLWPAAAAAELGINSRQSVQTAVASVWRAFERYRAGQAALLGASDAWQTVVLIAPPELVAEFRRMLSEYRAPCEEGPKTRRVVKRALKSKLPS
jgi:hypothetical protein